MPSRFALLCFVMLDYESFTFNDVTDAELKLTSAMYYDTNK